MCINPPTPSGSACQIRARYSDTLRIPPPNPPPAPWLTESLTGPRSLGRCIFRILFRDPFSIRILLDFGSLFGLDSDPNSSNWPSFSFFFSDSFLEPLLSSNPTPKIHRFTKAKPSKSAVRSSKIKVFRVPGNTLN